MVVVGAIISISFRLANQNKTYTPIPPDSEPYWIKDMAKEDIVKACSHAGPAMIEPIMKIT